MTDKQRLAHWIAEKTVMSEWFQSNYMLAKKEVGKRWDKITNLELEEAITGLVTDANESEGGLKTALLCWIYYSNMDNSKEASLYWVLPDKAMYYVFDTSKVAAPETAEVVSDTAVAAAAWGVFQIPDKKTRYDIRQLAPREAVEICENMVMVKAVNRPLGAMSKYTLAELVAVGKKVGLGEMGACKKGEWYERLQQFCANVLN